MKKLNNITVVVALMLVASIAVQSCSLFSAKERKREELAKVINKLNKNTSSMNSQVDSDLFKEFGQFTSCKIEGESVVFEVHLIDEAYSARNYTRDAQLFSLAVMSKNMGGDDAYMSKKIVDDLRVAEYNLVYRYIDKDNNTLDFTLTPDEITKIRENPIEVINSVNRKNVIYTIEKNEEASLRYLLEEDSDISIVDVSIDDDYETITLTYNVSNEDMEYVSVNAISRSLCASYQNAADDILVTQSMYALKELNLAGIRIVIKNQLGYRDEAILTWNEIESKPMSEQDVIAAQRQTIIKALSKSQKDEIGDGVVDSWAEERNNHIAIIYVLDGVTVSVDDIESLDEFKSHLISTMRTDEVRAEIEAYKEFGYIGYKFVYKNKGKSSEKVVTVNFNEI